MNNQEFVHWLDTNFENGTAEFIKNGLIDNLLMDEIDRQNTEIIINRGYSGQPGFLNKKKITENKVIKEILRFYNKFDRKLGKDIKKLYNKNKNKIHLNRYNIHSKSDFRYDDPSGGYTSENFLDVEGHMEIDFTENYTTYYTLAHEFMHMLEMSRGFRDEKLSEVNSRFVELALGDYLEGRGIISSDERKSHVKANNNFGYDCAIDIKNASDLLKLMREKASVVQENEHDRVTDNYIMDKDVINAFIERNCSGNVEQFISVISKIYEDIKKGESRSLQNKIRFINGTVGANLLYEMYSNNPKKFPQIYNKTLKPENANYEYFIGIIQMNVPNRVDILPHGNKFAESIYVSPFKIQGNNTKNQEQDLEKEEGHIEYSDDERGVE